MRSAAWKYISDAITKEEALAMLKKNETSKGEREALVRDMGYVRFLNIFLLISFIFCVRKIDGRDL